MSMTNEHSCRPQRDPVCGRQMTIAQGLLTSELKGRTYLFCSERCRLKFSIRPAWFVRPPDEPARRKAS
jgi:YHS domain-containing protein